MFALLAAVPLTVLSASDVASARVRPGTDGAATIDLLNVATLRADLSLRRIRFTAAYSPQFTLYDLIQSEAQPALYQQLGFSLAATVRRVTLNVGVTGAIGQLNRRLELGPLGTATPPPTAGTTDGSDGSTDGTSDGTADTPAPTTDPGSTTTTPPPSPTLRSINQTTWIGSTQWSARVGYRINRYSSAYVDGLYSVQGSLGEDTGVYPVQQISGGSAGVQNGLGRGVSLASAGSFSRIATAGLGRQYLAGWSETLQAALPRQWTVGLSLGISCALATKGSRQDITFCFPTANAILGRQSRGPNQFRWSFTLAPVVDQFTGEVDQRATALLGYGRRWGRLYIDLSGGGSASFRVTNMQAFYLVGANALAGWAITQELQGAVSAGASYQISDLPNQTGLVWAGGLQLSYAPRGIRL
jgi:hypothetical protein